MGFSFFSSKSEEPKKSSGMWKDLGSLDQFEEVMTASEDLPQLIFKHSTRCIISRTVLRNFEAEWEGESLSGRMYLLDLLQHRDISQAIGERNNVEHQSPQILLISKGKVLLHRSHQAITAEVIVKSLAVS